MLNKDLMSPFERLKADYMLYDKKQKKYIRNLKEIIAKKDSKIEELEKEIESLKSTLGNNDMYEQLCSLKAKCKEQSSHCQVLESKLFLASVSRKDVLLLGDDKAVLLAKLQREQNLSNKLQKQRSEDKKTIDYLLSKLNCGGK